jgi:hypothetical protein
LLKHIIQRNDIDSKVFATSNYFAYSAFFFTTFTCSHQLVEEAGRKAAKYDALATAGSVRRSSNDSPDRVYGILNLWAALEEEGKGR